jgi:hypothetical protein
MPNYQRLDIDVDAEPWQLQSTLALERALEGRIEDAPQPLAIDVDGRQPGALMTRSRGHTVDAVLDVLASPAFASILGRASLPHHSSVECIAEPMAFDLRTFRKKRKQKPLPFRWLWWTETFGRRIDLQRESVVVEVDGRDLGLGRGDDRVDAVAFLRAHRDRARCGLGHAPSVARI